MKNNIKYAKASSVKCDGIKNDCGHSKSGNLSKKWMFFFSKIMKLAAQIYLTQKEFSNSSTSS